MNVLGVDLGGTHMRCACVGPDGSVSGRVERLTPHDGSGTSALVELITAVRDAGGACQSAVIGVPGRVDYRAGILEQAPNLPPTWPPLLTERLLSDAVGVPVALANDADLAAVGEAYTGAGRDHSDVAYLTVSTGIGAGVVLGGLLVHGRRSLAEVGHAVIDLPAFAAGRPSTLEDLASGTAMGARGRAVGIGATGADVMAALRAGEPRAKEIWDGVLEALAVGVINLIWAFAPEVVVIGGGVGLSGDLLLDPLRAMVAPHDTTGCELVAAGLGDDAGLAGAASWHQAFVPAHAGRA